MYFVVVRPFTAILNKAKEKSLRSGECEVLLECIQSNDLNAEKCLPSIPANLVEESKQRQAISEYIYQNTSKSGSGVGFKAKKVITVKVTKNQSIQGCTNPDLSFYVVPISSKQDVTFNVSGMKFYLLSSIINEFLSQQSICHDKTLLILQNLETWLKKQFMRPFGLKGLFRAPALDRIRENVTNPAYATEPNRDWLLLENSLAPEQAMNKMKEIDKVDLFINNPIFGTDLHLYTKVDFLVVNDFFGQAAPNYSQLSIPNREQWFNGHKLSEERQELSWVEEFPVHRAAADGDVTGLAHILDADPHRVENWDHDGWAAAHYACWYGRVDALKHLLNQRGCDPNMCNKNSTSLLHLAAGCGHASIVKLLADHPYIDRHAIDKQGRSAMECCEQIRSKDWQKCMQLLKELSHKSYQKLLVHKMDGSEQAIELRCGSNTKVADVMSSLSFSFETRKYFALWITSKSLHLQLKPQHSPLVEIDKWPEILRQLGGVQAGVSQDETASIVLKRDVRLLPNVEEEVSDITSIHLLYEEARTQVLRGLYPCSDRVAVAMSSIVMRIMHGPYDAKRHKNSFFSDEILSHLLPRCKLRVRSVNWSGRIVTEYKEVSEQGPGEISQLQLLYLRYCWTQIPPYGSAFFTGYAYATKHEGGEKYQRVVPLYIGTNHRGVHFVKVENKALLVSVSYHSLKWTLNDEKKLFQIRTNDGKVNMIIHTPQAPLICSLMEKLSQASSPLL